MNIGSISTLSMPLPRPSQYGPDTGTVPPWLRRDLGHEAVAVTVPKHHGWYIAAK